MDIQQHPLWKNISPLKKPAHLMRNFMAKKMAQLSSRSSFIGVTGSVGKSTTVKFCQAVLSSKYNTLATTPDLSPMLAIPILLSKMRPNVKKAVLEMGAELPGEIDFYLSLVQPATVIVTRISYAHSQNLGNLSQITEEKGKLIKQLPKNGCAIINYDDIHSRKLANLTEAEVIYYGTDSRECAVWASNIRVENLQTVFELNYGVERIEIKLKMLGRHFAYAALAAAALGLSCEMTLVSIKKGLESIEPQQHNLQLFEGLGPWMVLDDTISSSPVAVEESLNVLNDLPARRRIVLLGEMKDLGGYSENLHRQIGQRIYKEKIDLVLLGTGDTKYLADELLSLGFSPERMEVNLSNSQLVANTLRVAGKGDVILVKGSRAVRLDEVVKRITRQT
ncbi:MAG: UDP-N-acetylmuramoyl-tripeptide--D-alanyl-D-alanine ligase [Patescibacteria group bacterium]|nr:UDP-N-acetylmuramoyl-tripeptide--D-alanyl-D-alanine ligase [Patescibacteria group bacterium]